MIKTYFNIAFRKLWKDKLFSAINIAGLAIGIAAALLIIRVVLHEWSYDRFHKNASDLYRIQSISATEKGVRMHLFSSKLAPQLEKDNPEIKSSTRILRDFGAIIKNPDNPTFINLEKEGLFVDPSFFEIFTFPLHYGNAPGLLDEPFSMVISEKMAQKYFGNENPVGKTLDYNTGQLFTITGVAKNAPTNSTIKFDFLSSLDTYAKINQFAFDNLPNFETFLFLENPNALQRVERNIKAVNAFIKPLVYNASDSYRLEPIDELRFDGSPTSNTEIGRKTINTILGIGALILSLAIFNYINLATARASIRAKEVGVRKAIGAKRPDLIRQFLLESTILTFFSFILGIGLSIVLGKPFNQLLGLQIDLPFPETTSFFQITFLLFLLIAFFAGSYPALVLSGFSPIAVLKGNFSKASRGTLLRKSFIVFQFTVSAALIFCSLIIWQQIRHMSHQDLGYNKDQVLNLKLGKVISEKSESFKQEMAALSGMDKISLSSATFFGGYSSRDFTVGAKNIASKMVIFEVDNDFVKNLDLKWKVVPNKNATTNHDGFYISVNETAVKELGFTNENILGKALRFEHNGPVYGTVAGVIKDFSISGPQFPTQPTLFLHKKESLPADGFRFLQVRLDPKNDIREKLAALEIAYRKYDQETPFQYSFLDDDFQKMFSIQTRTLEMVRIFTIIAVMLACLGLLGLVAFIGQTRRREICIRKVMGASVPNIFSLLSKDFLLLTLISILFASPIAWYAMNTWLQGFVSKVQINWLTFVFGGVISLATTLLTISYHGIKAALTNPAEALRSE